LLLYLDSGSTQTTGAVTQNTLTGPSPVVTENLNVQPTNLRGTVYVTSNRSFVISGYVNTSKGKVTTKVAQSANFSSHQYFNISATKYVENVSQNTTLNSNTTVTRKGVPAVITSQDFTFPLTVDISEVVLSNGNINQTTNANQTYQDSTTTTQSGAVTYSSFLKNAGQHVDTLEFDSGFNFLGNTGQSSAQQYNYFDSTGAVYNCAIAAANNALTAFDPGCTQ